MKYGICNFLIDGDTDLSLGYFYNNKEVIFRELLIGDFYPFTSEEEIIDDRFNIINLNKEELIDWCKNNTKMKQLSENVFEINPIKDIIGYVVPQRLFTID